MGGWAGWREVEREGDCIAIIMITTHSPNCHDHDECCLNSNYTYYHIYVFGFVSKYKHDRVITVVSILSM